MKVLPKSKAPYVSGATGLLGWGGPGASGSGHGDPRWPSVMETSSAC